MKMPSSLRPSLRRGLSFLSLFLLIFCHGQNPDARRLRPRGCGEKPHCPRGAGDIAGRRAKNPTRKRAPRPISRLRVLFAAHRGGRAVSTHNAGRWGSPNGSRGRASCAPDTAPIRWRRGLSIKNFQKVRSELVYRVKEAWYALFENKKLTAIELKNEALLMTAKRDYTRQMVHGTAKLTDGLQVEAMIDAAAVELAILEEQERLLRLRFNTLLRRPPKAPVALPDTLAIKERPRKASGIHHPALRNLHLKMAATEARRKQVTWQRWPHFGVGVNYARVERVPTERVVDKDIVGSTLRMSLPVWRAKYRAAVREIDLKKTALQAEYEGMKDSIHISRQTAWYQASKAYKRIALYERQMEKTRQIVALTTADYENGADNFESILDEQSEVLAYERQYYRAVREYCVALSQLDYLTTEVETYAGRKK